MTNDLIMSTGTAVVERGSTGATRTDEPSPTTAPRPDLDGQVRSFADVAEARDALRSVRSLLGRHLDGVALVDALLVLVCAKVIDETTGDDLEFVASEGEPRVTASRFDDLNRAARRQLLLDPTDPGSEDTEVPELVAHEVVRILAPFSIMLTADQPDGRQLLGGAFAEIVADTGSLDPASAFARPDVASRALGLVATSGVAAHDGALALAAAEVFGGPAGHGAHRADPVIDLTDGAPRSAAGAPARTT